ncbi:tetratricopeptide repeat protein 12-like isoform X2 [Leptopilina boulardi]|uniref:tetratricopeptide repeat protein 12-like isoform X2 n=1 Tax=Leptopilina boulardi TaxID=63433 RepID=UPI0021F5C077|nr:tetratricopeptide repeat protein 12-like isoform X2 [Leptopilina boulardi]
MNFENKFKGKVEEGFLSDKHTTQEEFENFMHRVTDVEKIVKKLASSDLNEQNEGKLLADEILEGNLIDKELINDNCEIQVKTNRTLINKYSTDGDNSKEKFMKNVEWDAKQRANDRKMHNERAETYKIIGNGAFKEKNYEKALTYYSRAIEYRKDSTILWNNRALTYIKLQKYKKAIKDCEWVLKINQSNIKALLNLAKCHAQFNNQEKCQEYINLAKDRNSQFINYINDFERELKIGRKSEKSK